MTIELEDIHNEQYNVTEKKFSFECHGGPQQQEYRFELELFGEIDPSKSKMRKTDRHMTVILEKKDKKGHFWPRLTESKAKIHFVHTDFNKWKDEDDTSDEDDRMNDDFQSMMSRLNTDDLGGNADEEDSDDEEMPDLEPVKKD